MATFVLSFVLLVLAVTGMAAGVLMGRKPIAGSCGGLGNGCAACTRRCARRGRGGDGGEDVDDEEERP